MKPVATEKIDIVNIAFIFLSGALAMVMPFELFLFSYAILGPLHYLTEISWLHDKGYFTRKKSDAVFLAVICLCLSLIFFNSYYHLTDIELPANISAMVTWSGLMLAILFVTVRQTMYRLLGVVAILISLKIANLPTVAILLTIFLPTLIHVYVFTGLFMLYGALKAKSRMGLLSVFAFVICPVLLVTLWPGFSVFEVTEYGIRAYTGGETNFGFQFLNIDILQRFFGQQVMAGNEQEARTIWINSIFYSPNGIIIARLIAFAYTYHYLNWFSKTRVIQWHNVPRSRFIVVIITWLISVSLYVIDYTLGLVWLFFLSYMHVILELPLNAVSVIGIYKSLKSRNDNRPAETVKAR